MERKYEPGEVASDSPQRLLLGLLVIESFHLSPTCPPQSWVSLLLLSLGGICPALHPALCPRRVPEPWSALLDPSHRIPEH